MKNEDKCYAYVSFRTSFENVVLMNYNWKNSPNYMD